MRWARPESVHLTLKFLGDVPADTLPAIHQALRQAAEGLAPFSVVAQGLGCFPNASRPRVLWMGLDDPRRELLQLQRHIESTLAALEVSVEERPFRPHLTLARTRGTRVGEELNALLSEYKNHLFGYLVVSQIHLMRSDLYEKGAVHTRLCSAALQGSNTNCAIA
jgi:2'-5' RNA ligase